MEIVKCKYKMRCEIGGCGNRADYTILPRKSGVRGSLHLCEKCLKEIAKLSKSPSKSEAGKVSEDSNVKAV